MNELPYISMINARLSALIESADTYPLLEQAMHYSVLAGGKRLRPTLHIMACEMLGGNANECLDVACAIEMIHTYSLVHDDLPAMDDDSIRRGKPTVHMIYGDAVAILAGDALLSYAVQVMMANALRYQSRLTYHVQAMDIIMTGCGTKGMLAGQTADVVLEGRDISEDDLRYIHERKTGGLIAASVCSGAAIAGASSVELAAVHAFGSKLGMCFQIMDDVLDVEGSTEALGKHPGKDKLAGKTTYASMYGVEKSRQTAAEYAHEAACELVGFGKAAQPLVQLAEKVARRDR